MAADSTEYQSYEQQREARQLSLRKTRPPIQVPNYQIERFLGSGAYGEVWVALDRRTGRRVAIKFYTHRGGVDWPLLHREVEKLVFLAADRYVVQLLDVGWETDPPYFVMEYIENGSLEDWLATHGPMAVQEAVQVFHEVVVGLLHAHGRGILHCDLKPANVLLDQDHRPRLADFGQSRLTHEQTPSLGTLFYMAPEQASLDALPDARWDVYALGAMLYAMLTGGPPHRTPEALEILESAPDLPERLRRYRRLIQEAPPPQAHRRVPGIDRALIELIDNCLEPDPKRRLPNVQAVLDALLLRERARARRPLLVLGFVGPLILLLVMALFGWRGYVRAKTDSDQALTARALEKNHFAAKAVAGAAAQEIERYFRAVEDVAQQSELAGQLARAQQPNSPLLPLLLALRDPNKNTEPLEERQDFLEHPDRQPVQQIIDHLLASGRVANAASWFVTDAYGTQVAAAFEEENVAYTVGQNYGWRTYFHGGPRDEVRRSRLGTREILHYEWPDPHRHIERTHLSAPFQSKATNRWKVAISTPLYHQGQFVGILAVTVDIGVFVHFEEGSDHFFAVLVDGRPGDLEGMILEHPLFENVLQKNGRLPDEFSRRRVPAEALRAGGTTNYQDPLGWTADGEAFRRRWIAAVAPVMVRVRNATDSQFQLVDTGLKVIVQEDYHATVEPVRQLGIRLLWEGITALVIVVSVILGMWAIVLRAVRQDYRLGRPLLQPVEPTSRPDSSTLAADTGREE
ncbi:MAG: serine/threonine protein kinase [Pirellulaceae bacterium]|nr:MAG: serine/threonine protein kinase [Pirellulaceae bacterium]